MDDPLLLPPKWLVQPICESDLPVELMLDDEFFEVEGHEGD